MALFKRVLRVVGIFAAFVLLVVATYAVYVYVGLRSSAKVDGTIQHLNVRRPVTIVRDWRGVPYIRAGNEHDLFFANGYAQGADRLFQLELLRHYVYGTLSEIFGKFALSRDEVQRTVPVAEIVERQYKELPQRERDILTAFADGVNAAMCANLRLSSFGYFCTIRRSGVPKIRSRSPLQRI